MFHIYTTQGFNPRARTGRDRLLRCLIRKHGFQSTRPHRARLRLLRCLIRKHGFQSTRPHRARLAGSCSLCWIARVSIHAPAQGATKMDGLQKFGAMFQSTRPHRARPGHNDSVKTLPGFNPRARTGRDQRRGRKLHPPPSFNPRARTGRDISFSLSRQTASCFNPRARTGRDQVPAAIAAAGQQFQSTRPHRARPRAGIVRSIEDVFQSTRPHRARPIAHLSVGAATGFNPRARTGRDDDSLAVRCKLRTFQSTRPHRARQHVATSFRAAGIVSIHAPAQGATLLLVPSRQGNTVSIHAPAQGATLVLLPGLRHAGFQSTRPHRARRYQNHLWESVVMFQSTRPHRARRFSRNASTIPERFNPRARTGRD